MNEELISKIKADLDKSGFGSEMRALQTLLTLGWKATGSDAYLDKEEHKTRELDISAHKRTTRALENTEIYGEVFFEINADVKQSRAPWVLFKRPTNADVELGLGWTNLVFRDGVAGSPSSNLTKALFRSTAEVNGWLASAIHESFKKPDQTSRWYGACAGVCKAGEHSLQANSWANDVDDDSEAVDPDAEDEINGYVFFVQPAIILDGILVAAELDADAQIQIQQVQMATIEFPFQSQAYTKGRYHVDIVTLDALADYVAFCDVRLEALADGLAADLAKQHETKVKTSD